MAIDVTEHWRERFAAFARHKKQLATAAALPPYVTALENPDDEMIVLGNGWSRQLFDGSFYLSQASVPRRPSCSLVFVQSADGNTGASDPGALGGGETDKHLVYEGLSRVAVDAVLTGAETLRGADLVFSIWHPELVELRGALGLPRHPVQVVATLRGLDVNRTLLFNVPELEVIVITVPGRAVETMQVELAGRPWVRTIFMEDPEDLPGAFEQLRHVGIARVSCVGGRRIAAQLLDLGLVDDLYLTTSPRAGGEPNTPLHSKAIGGHIVVRKLGTGSESGVVFEHLAKLG